MFLSKVFQKVLSVTLSIAFMTWQSGFAFATGVSNWDDLRTGVAGTPGDYNVTTALTADENPNGTLSVDANGSTVTGAKLTQNSTHDTLINVASGVSFGLGNDIEGSIVNAGTLNYSGSSLTGGTITGDEGVFNFTASGDVTNANAITQDTVSVASTTNLDNNAAITATTITNEGTLVSSATNLVGAVTNDNALTLTGGATQGAISGSGDTSITADLTNAHGITQTTVSNSGVLTNNAAITAAITNTGTIGSTADNLKGTVDNSGTLNIAGGTTQGAISGTGTTNITDALSSNYAITQNSVTTSGSNITVSQNALLTASVTNGSGVTLEIAPENVGGAVDNSGIVKLNADGTLSQNISGIGQTEVHADVELNDANSISQNVIKVETGAQLTANANNLITSGTGAEVLNHGQLNLTGGTNANAINGDGAVEFSGTGTIINNGAIQQVGGVVNAAAVLQNNALITAEITNNNNKRLESVADNLNGKVHNNGSLFMQGGTTQEAIDGDGNLFITGDTSNAYNIDQVLITAQANFGNSGLISLENLEVETGNTVTNTNKITVTTDVVNAGTIENQAGATFDNSDSTGVITNTGNITNAGTFNAYTVNNNAGGYVSNSSDMSFASVDNAAGATFYQDGGHLNISGTTATFSNSGTFQLDDGDAYLASLTNNSTGDVEINDGSLTVETLTNSAAVEINGGSLTATTLQNNNSFHNDGTVNAVNFTNDGEVIGNGTTNISGDSTNNGDFTQQLVNISNNATFTNNGMLLAKVTNEAGSTVYSDPDNLGDDVANDGLLDLNADGTLSVAITGNGETDINGDLTNNGSISQKDIKVASGKVVTSNASDMTASNVITNDGIINYTAGTTDNTITGSGRVDITGYVTNTGDIDQTTVSNSSVFTNNGTVTANLSNTNAIEGTGSIVTKDGISSNKGTIDQASLENNGTFANEGYITLTGALINNDTFNTNADLLAADDGVNNAGNLNLTGGTNENEITGTGFTNFTNIVVNEGAITQNSVTNAGTLTNNALIKANVENTGKLTSEGDNIDGTVANFGEYFISDGDNANDIIGAGGTTSILGDTTNTGTIIQEALKIANSGNLTTDAGLVTASITNDGKLTWNAGTANQNVVSGTGELYIDGADIVNSNTISQGDIRINSGSLTSDADLLTSVNGITNSADLTFTGGTNANAISGGGDLTITGVVTNQASIIQNSIVVGAVGQLTTNADLLMADIENEGDISFTGGNNNNDISGTGTTTIDGTVTNAADISTDILVSATGNLSTLTDITSKVENRNVVQIIDADITSTGKIQGSGATNILGATTNSGVIDSSAVNIAAGGHLTTDSDKVTGAIANEGDLTWTAGTSNTNAITGNGSLEITGGTIANTASISQDNITISGGSLTSSADLLASAGGITNNATLGITGGTNNNIVTGTGTTDFTGDVTNKATITQATVTNVGNLTNNALITANVTNSGAFTTDGANVLGAITNSGNYVITNGDNANNISGTGDVTIQGTTVNSGAIAQDNVIIASAATFVAADMSDITTTTGIDNAGIFEMQSGTNTNQIIGNTGALKVTGEVTNTAGVSITQDTLDIATLGSFTVDAGDINTVNGIINSGALTLGDGATANAISGTGTLAVTGTVTNTGTISQKSLTNTGAFTSDASLLAFADGIANGNNLTFTGGTNANAITGAGTTYLTGDVTNDATIAQSALSNTANLTNNAAITADVTNSGTIDNNAVITGTITNTGTIDSLADDLAGAVDSNGTLNIEGGTTQAAITGTGVMNITGDLVNNFTIAQATVNNDADMVNNAAITADFNNNGTLDNAATITGAITNAGTINSVADDLNGTVTNNATLNVDGGTTQAAITGSGDMNITADLVNNFAINQTNVDNQANLANGATITATDITNSGTITGKASDLIASNEIANDGTLVFNAASTGASKITGTGDVQVTANTTLTGTNDYTGGTLIDGATLTVAGQSNLGTGDIAFANTGILAITAAGALDNVLKGNAATEDITVDNAAALTLNTATGTAADFHKAGTGAMTFAMASNGYTGDTYVDGGTLIGNTANINNTVFGAAGTTVEFNDTTDADLNEINTLGNFVQSGSAVLNVQNNGFTAAQADINAGTFAANRALTATTLNVNNGAILRGNGNITGTVNVNSGGTIAPGNSIDTLTITGNANFASGSTTAIEINETPASDKLVITGNANIASGANLTVSNENGRYFDWKSFEIVNAGNVAGEFTYDGTITDYDASRINVEVDYSDPTKVVLTAKRKATSHAGVTGLSRNESEVARAVDAVSTGFGGDITNALLQLEKLGGLNPTGVTLIDGSATLQSALANMDGVLYANSALATLFNAKTAHVYDRIAKRNPSAGKCATCHDNVWAEYYSQYDKVYSNENSPRFTNNMTGVLVGYDRSSEDVLLGVYGGAGKSDLRQQHDTMDIEDTSLGIYAGYRPDNWVFKGTLFGGYQTYHGKRSINFMARSTKGKYHGMNLALDLEGGYNVAVYDWLNLKPFVGVLGNYAHLESFTETGAGALNLHVESKNQFNTQARLGVQLEGKIGKRFNWYGSAAVKQFIGGDYAKLHMSLGLPGTRMEIISAELGRTYFSGQVGVSYALTNHWTVYGNLDTGVNNKSTNCYGNVGLAYTW